jgi:hypothetical protein
MKKGKIFLIACMIAAGTCFYVQPSAAQTSTARTTSQSSTNDYDNDGYNTTRRGVSPWWGMLGLLGLLGLTGTSRKRVERHDVRPANTGPR